MNQDVQVQLIKMALEDKIRINRKLMDLAIKSLTKRNGNLSRNFKHC